jgi:hypothetical protein
MKAHLDINGRSWPFLSVRYTIAPSEMPQAAVTILFTATEGSAKQSGRGPRCCRIRWHLDVGCTLPPQCSGCSRHSESYTSQLWQVAQLPLSPHIFSTMLHIALVFCSCHRCQIILLPFIFSHGIVSCSLGSCKDKLDVLADGERNYRIS